MSSSWRTEIVAVLLKEIHSEIRSKAGLMSSGLFSLVTVIALAVAAFNRELSPGLSAGLIWVALLFASAISLPRAFLLEEEQGTMDILRLTARPHAIFWGKSLFNLIQMLLTGFFLSFLFLFLTNQTLGNVPLFAVCLLGGCGALAGTVTLCGAIVAQAKNRSALAGALALPLLLPLAFLAVEALRVPLGSGDIMVGWRGAAGLIGYGVATLAIGPYLFAAVWKS
ncbi:MAG TPA: heme exporter protein CcmB [Fimbriimonas sp.]